MTEPIVELSGISKSFAGIRALDGVDFAARRGSTHAIMGENGAGKSTLIKIISGVLAPDAGEIVPALMRDLDLSVGAVMTLAACVASALLTGSGLVIGMGMVATLAVGTGFGLINGLIVVHGCIQPIIATLATGAVAIGLTLLIRPQPGGKVDGDARGVPADQLWRRDRGHASDL